MKNVLQKRQRKDPFLTKGSGKTATAILGWLWRFFHSKNPTPRRLVYCLPMRVLVEQTRNEANRWIDRLNLPVRVHILMGGEEFDDWDLDPDKPAILIGTQDMLLSRALNRGYGMSRFRWPMHFGLLNNDCLWVLDEIQLMGVGLATSAQMQAFRTRFGPIGLAQTVWMSATLLPSWLETVDFRNQVPNLSALSLTKADYVMSGQIDLDRRMKFAGFLAQSAPLKQELDLRLPRSGVEKTDSGKRTAPDHDQDDEANLNWTS